MSVQQIIEQVRQHLVGNYPADRLLLLQYLQAVQQAENFISSDNIRYLAELCRVSVNDVQQVIDFYSFLETTPPPVYRILVSDNIIDRMQGSHARLNQLLQAFTTRLDMNSADDLVRISLTSCTGMSDQSPAVMINGITIAGMNEARTGQVITCIKQRIPLDQWPPELFQVHTSIQQAGPLMTAATGRQLFEHIKNSPACELLQMLEASGLRGRGGAGFATAKKWQLCKQTDTQQRYVVCNADEGEPGTFKDRVLLETNANALLDGMTLCARIVNATQGFIYLRGEYRYLLPHLHQILQQRRQQQLLGENIYGVSGFDFDIDIHLGAGAYVCGEESALLESLEGQAGIPRNRPPFPVQQGYRAEPTVVNNVETFAAAAFIAEYGADRFRETGTPDTSGNKILSVSGDCSKPGIYEVPFGISISELLQLCNGVNTQFVQVGGAAGRTLSPAQFEHRLCYSDIATAGSIMIFDNSRDLFATGQNFCDFFAHESCGFCTPCRVGTSLQQDLFKRLAAARADTETLRQLDEISALLHASSHCGLGSTAANFIEDIKRFFPERLQQQITEQHFSEVDINAFHPDKHSPAGP